MTPEQVARHVHAGWNRWPRRDLLTATDERCRPFERSPGGAVGIGGRRDDDRGACRLLERERRERQSENAGVQQGEHGVIDETHGGLFDEMDSVWKLFVVLDVDA